MTSKRHLTGSTAFVALFLSALAVAPPLDAQEDRRDVTEWTAPSHGEVSVAAIPFTGGDSAYGVSGLTSSQASLTGRRRVELGPAWTDARRSAWTYPLWGAGLGATAGLVLLMGWDSDCLRDQPSDMLGCGPETSIPIYVGGGAIIGGTIGWTVDRITR